MQKICLRCKRKIKDKDNYFAFVEFKDGKKINTDYAHKQCWDNFLKNIGDTAEAMGVVRGLKNSLVKMGVLPEEEVIIR